MIFRRVANYIDEVQRGEVPEVVLPSGLEPDHHIYLWMGLPKTTHAKQRSEWGRVARATSVYPNLHLSDDESRIIAKNMNLAEDATSTTNCKKRLNDWYEHAMAMQQKDFILYLSVYKPEDTQQVALRKTGVYYTENAKAILQHADAHGRLKEYGPY